MNSFVDDRAARRPRRLLLVAAALSLGLLAAVPAAPTAAAVPTAAVPTAAVPTAAVPTAAVLNAAVPTAAARRTQNPAAR